MAPETLPLFLVVEGQMSRIGGTNREPISMLGLLRFWAYVPPNPDIYIWRDITRNVPPNSSGLRATNTILKAAFKRLSDQRNYFLNRARPARMNRSCARSISTSPRVNAPPHR